ncbi:uncharacterized protein ACO6RY_15206 [Pungitius sinensis]
MESHRVERAREREGERSTNANTDMRRIYRPSAPSFFFFFSFFSSAPRHPASLRFTSVSMRREPPCSGGVPSYISAPRAESLNQIYGFRTSVRETSTTDLQHPSWKLWRN